MQSILSLAVMLELDPWSKCFENGIPGNLRGWSPYPKGPYRNPDFTGISGLLPDWRSLAHHITFFKPTSPAPKGTLLEQSQRFFLLGRDSAYRNYAFARLTTMKISMRTGFWIYVLPDALSEFLDISRRRSHTRLFADPRR